MTDIAIKIENLSKKYMIGKNMSPAEEGAYVTFREVLADKAKNIFSSKNMFSSLPSNEEFWALKDIDLQIEKGKKIGIMGRNGAGKSTLLKILSRIMKPTTGKVTITGRVTSLLEVGTGFHFELTGRENIFLNGSILGLTYSEISKKFDEVVAFSGVEKFIDTPVKRYSSGMRTRLGFAVAAHLESEILIVDEVLAVGDAEFQKKCLGKMEEVSRKEGRTILFVSHNINAMKYLCDEGVLLDQGRLLAAGPIDECAALYSKEQESKECKLEHCDQRGHTVVLESFHLVDEEGKPVDEVDYRQPLCFVLKVKSTQPYQKLHFLMGLQKNGKNVLLSDSREFEFSVDLDSESKEIRISYPHISFLPGTIVVSRFIIRDGYDLELYDLKNIFSFEVLSNPVPGKNKAEAKGGYICGESEWELIG